MTTENDISRLQYNSLRSIDTRTVSNKSATYRDIPDVISAFPVFERLWEAELDQLGNNQDLEIEIPSQGPAAKQVIY